MKPKVNKFLFAAGIFFASFPLYASEIIEETNTKVIVREHSKTGRPYVSIVAKDSTAETKEPSRARPHKRPDYRLLDPKVKSGEISYQGPYSDRKKVYVFAASLAALGTAGGAAVAAIAPAATTAGASSGAGAYAVAGGAVAAGSISAGLASNRADPDKDKFQKISRVKLLQPTSNKRDK